MRRMWIVGLAFALAFFMAYGEEEGFGGGGGLVGLITLNLSELNAALAAAGFPELPEGLIVTGGGGWGGILSGPVLGGLGFEGTTEALSGELRTSLTLGYGAFTLELARKLGERALLGAGIGLGGGSAELEVRTRFATDFQDALSAPTVTRLNADFFAALLYLRLQFQPLPPRQPLPRGAEWLDAVDLERPQFFGDGDRYLKRVQQETYPYLIFELFSSARDRYLAACRLLGRMTELGRRSAAIQRFQIPFLKSAYRRMAAYYRFAFVTGPQLPLPFDRLSFDTRMRVAWESFFRRETKALVRLDPCLLAILKAAVHFGRPAGRAAEARLVDMLEERYGDLTLERRVALLRLKVSAEELIGWRHVERQVRTISHRQQEPKEGGLFLQAEG